MISIDYAQKFAPMSGENRWLVTDGQVDFEKQRLK